MKTRLLLIAAIFATVLMPVAASAEPALTVGVAYDIGGRGDRSFNDASHAGLEKAQKQFDFELVPVVTDGSSADREKRIRSLIAKNCDPIIAIGSGYAPTLQALAVEYPSTHFAIINDASVAALNVTSVIFADNQGAFLAGFSAAQLSKSGKVAMIANPDQADIYKDGFSAGVAAAKRKVIPIVKYVSGSYSLATTQVLDAGADIVFVTTQGSDSEILKVIASRGAKKKGAPIGMINVEPDQFITITNSTKRFLLATVIKRVDKAMYDIVALSLAKRQYLDILDENAGIYGRRYGITGGGIELTVRSNSLLRLSNSINAAAAIAEKIPA
ncbi:MAG: BMP family ABC transporter substrate-binding protein [Candidatus Planktophila sp.]|nr:BMP family ABC transporter substrate-binding protein [Candidatus Planktophila sp.]MBP7902790.1 BMP family ABC transporter substrate-binding protein [Candidatus Planktophila sp.]